jgi:hypothetical protein
MLHSSTDKQLQQQQQQLNSCWQLLPVLLMII